MLLRAARSAAHVVRSRTSPSLFLSRLGMHLDWNRPQLRDSSEASLLAACGTMGPWLQEVAVGRGARGVLPHPALPAACGFAGSAFITAALLSAHAVTRGLCSQEPSAGWGAAGAGRVRWGHRHGEWVGPDVQPPCTLCTHALLPPSGTGSRPALP